MEGGVYWKAAFIRGRRLMEGGRLLEVGVYWKPAFNGRRF